jgi:hypothetical protein
MREKQIQAGIDSVEKKAENLCSQFYDFTDGARMILLLQRKKDGGSNDEDRRVFESYITYSREEFKIKLKNLLWLKTMSKLPLRVYLSVNSRDMKKVVRYIKTSLLEADYADEVTRENTHKKLLRNPRHFFMQQTCKASSYFILDIDDGEDDEMGKALERMSELKVVEILRYRTKNGWHIVTEPFNPNTWDVGEIKKDGLLLLDY